ncbi:unnamed protein product [Clonostachys rosea f. rosea IK726]|uniref:Uncharacterized protein n=1 Tax=Clonostachys rosea f. rosea IK726 TaxID=1349383 RepID=A0ACA9TII2_BIOOC|nr:unnamed protein product [Clonostachys rosea f. rosea IK726]
MAWTKRGIRVNSLSPGFLKTTLTYSVDTSPDWDLKMRYYGARRGILDVGHTLYQYTLTDRNFH